MAKKKINTEETTETQETKKFVKINDGLTYIQRMTKQKEERKKDRDKKDKSLNLDEHEKNIKELDSFIVKVTKTLDVETLSERDSIPFWINTNCYALNWIIANDFFKGLPGTKAIMLSGECLDRNTKLKIKVDDKFFEFLKNY